MKESFFVGGGFGGTVARAETRPSSGWTSGPSPRAAHLPGPLSAAFCAQPRRLLQERALLTDSVLLLSYFTAFLTGAGRLSGIFSPLSGCVPKTSGPTVPVSRRRNLDNRRRQLKRVAQHLKLLEPPRRQVGMRSHPGGCGKSRNKVSRSLWDLASPFTPVERWETKRKT